MRRRRHGGRAIGPRLSRVTKAAGRARVGFGLINARIPGGQRSLACISSRITTVIQGTGGATKGTITDLMSHSQFHCNARVYLDMHGLIFETSICYWQDQPGSRTGGCGGGAPGPAPRSAHRPGAAAAPGPDGPPRLPGPGGGRPRRGESAGRGPPRGGPRCPFLSPSFGRAAPEKEAPGRRPGTAARPGPRAVRGISPPAGSSPWRPTARLGRAGRERRAPGTPGRPRRRYGVAGRGGVRSA